TFILTCMAALLELDAADTWVQSVSTNTIWAELSAITIFHKAKFRKKTASGLGAPRVRARPCSRRSRGSGAPARPRSRSTPPAPQRQFRTLRFGAGGYAQGLPFLETFWRSR